MKIIDTRCFLGRNIYSHKPAIKLIVDLGKYKDIPTNEIEGFNERLFSAFPNIAKHTCNTGKEGGFSERVERGTYLAHVLEHLILEIQLIFNYRVKYGKTKFFKEPAQYCVIFEYENKDFALACACGAVKILNAFIKNKNFDTEKFLNGLNEIKYSTDLGPSTAAIAREAGRRGIPVTRLDNGSLIRLGYGKYGRLMRATLSDATSSLAVDTASDKQLTKKILSQNFIPVPYGEIVYGEGEAVKAAENIGYPAVIKPYNANHGKGVALNLKTAAEVKRAYKEAKKFSGGIIVEQFVKGNDYRVLVVGGKISAVAHRKPAQITGDGVHTVKELAEIENKSPLRGNGHEKPLTQIKLDDTALNILKVNGHDLNYIPQKSEEVFLRDTGNISSGGTATDCTDIIHKENAALAVKAAEILGIDIAGVDMVCEDISKPILKSGGVIVEVNAAPGIRMHHYPSSGKPRNAAKDILDALFPLNSPSLPVVSVTGTNGKTTTVRLISHVLRQTGKTVGTTCTSGSYINGERMCGGDNSGAECARQILANKRIDAAVLETARGGIIKRGLGYDLADVGVITNVTGDHLGLDGVETIKDLARVKALVVEAVKPDGYAVLNAGDKMTNAILKSVTVKVILFYRNEADIKVKNYKNYINAFTESGYIKIKDGGEVFNIAKVKDIPIVFNGAAECNINNCLAAVSALYALKTPLEAIAEGLKGFKDNEGRFQIFKLDGYNVMLDYAHNFDGYNEIRKFCASQKCKRIIGVIGMPGDRRDGDIKKAAALSAEAFNKIIIKEDKDLRSRKPGEVADLLYSELIKSKFQKENIEIIENEEAAFKHALSAARKGDLIVCLYDKIEPLIKQVKGER